MKKYIIGILLGCASMSASAQYTKVNEVKNGSNYDLTYINVEPIEDLRKHKSGTKAIAIMGLLPIDLPKIIDADDSTDNDLDNRLPEYIFPNYRFYRSEKDVTTIGIVYAQTSSNYQGDVVADTTTGAPESYAFKSKKRKIALRIANDKHFNTIRFRRFDLDPYWGVSGSLGLAPQVIENNATYVGGDYVNSKLTKRYVTLGLDAYFGCNVMFERFSIGLEMIAFGGDFQKGAGVNKVQESQSFGGTVVDREYYTSDDWYPGTQFSDLKMSDNQVSMYRGIRGIFCFYLD